MEKSLAWSKATKGIWHGVLGYAILSIISWLLSVLIIAASTVSKVSKFAESGDASALSGGGFMEDVAPILVSIATLVFIWMIISNLGKWRDLVDANDAGYVSRIRTAFIINIVAVVIGMLPIPLAGAIISGILIIIAFIMQLTAYSSLKNSKTLPQAAANGMSNLFTYTILVLIGTLLGFIPLLGIVCLIIKIVAIIFMLMGWAKVGNSTI